MDLTRSSAREHIEQLVEAINRTHARSFQLLHRFGAGSFGAWKVTDAAGERRVLKWFDGEFRLAALESAAHTTARLRVLGYPAPTYELAGVALGGSYGLQSLLPGRPADVVTPPLAAQAVALTELQRGQGVDLGRAYPDQPTWPGELAEDVLRGGRDGWFNLDRISHHSARARRVLTLAQELVRAAQDTPCPQDDVVHFDFSPLNLLAERDRLVGVVDWEGVRRGDATFDLATLLFYSWAQRPVRDQLWSAARACGPAGLISLYLAYLCVRNLDLSLAYPSMPPERVVLRAEWILADLAREM